MRVLILKAFWVAFITFLGIYPSLKGGIERSQALVMVVAWLVFSTFPLSIIPGLIGFALTALLGDEVFNFQDPRTRFLADAILAIAFGFVGYLQWFVLLPKLVSKIGARNRSFPSPRIDK